MAWCVVLGVSLATADMSGLSRAGAWRLLPAFAAGGAVALVVVLQSLPAGIVLPASPVWSQAEGVLGRPLHREIAATGAPPWLSAGPSICCLLAFSRFFLLGRDRADSDRTLRWVALAGAAYVLGGIANVLIDPATVLWRPKRAYMEYVTGPFFNRNTAATYFGSCALVAEIVVLRALRQDFGGAGSLRDVATELSRTRPRLRLAVFGIAWAVCIGGVLLTGSRAGTLLTVGCSVLVLVLWLRRWSYRRAPAMIVGLGIVALCLEIFGGVLGGRISTRGLGDVSRLDTYRDAWRMLAEAPWFGTGLGTFEFAFPPYRTASSPGVWDRAHSTFLEMAIELGVPATLCVFAAGAWTAFALYRGVRRPGRQQRFALAALAVGLLGTVHSLVDFSLQITGYAITVAALAGIGLAQTGHRAVPVERRPVSRSRRSDG